jgi:predicted outer membrane protein
MSDIKWLRTALSTNLSQLKGAQTVLKSLPSGPTRKFASVMVKEHARAVGQFRMLAKRLKVTIPKPLQKAHRHAVKQIRDRTRFPGLQRAYLRWVAQGHVRAVKMYERELRMGRHPLVRALARAQKPNVIRHGRLASSLLKRLVPARRLL